MSKIIIEDEHKVRKEVTQDQLNATMAEITKFNESNPKGQKKIEKISENADEAVYKIKVRMEM